VRLWCDAEFGELPDFDYGGNGLGDYYDIAQADLIRDMCAPSGLVYDSTVSANTWDTTRVKTMDGAFQAHLYCDLEIDGWQTDAVTNMNYMFKGAKKFNQKLNAWQTNAVPDMLEMFMDANTFNQPLDAWMQPYEGTPPATTNLRNMFYTAGRRPLKVELLGAFNQNINGWQTQNVKELSYMFSGVRFNQPMNSWDVSSVTKMKGMFENNDQFRQSLNSWPLPPKDSAGRTDGFVYYGDDKMFQYGPCSSTRPRTCQVTAALVKSSDCDGTGQGGLATSACWNPK